VTPANVQHFWLWRAIGWGLLALVASGSLAHLPGSSFELPQGDKYKHVLGYAIVGFWFAQLYPATVDRRKTFLLLLGFGVAIEIAQGVLTSYRSADPLDALANTVGLLCGYALALKVRLLEWVASRA
jgi:VanZ family protein